MEVALELGDGRRLEEFGGDFGKSLHYHAQAWGVALSVPILKDEGTQSLGNPALAGSPGKSTARGAAGAGGQAHRAPSMRVQPGGVPVGLTAPDFRGPITPASFPISPLEMRASVLCLSPRHILERGVTRPQL